MPRPIGWSGDGFWPEPLVHVSVTGQVDAHQDLRRALTPEGWELVAAEVSPDGRWVVAAVESAEPTVDHAPDLLIATRQGSVVHRFSRAVPTELYSKGTAVFVLWSPNSAQFVVCGSSCSLVSLDRPEPANWQPLPDPTIAHAVSWSPGGERLFIPGAGVVSKDGALLLAVDRPEAVWNPDGTALVTSGTVTELRMDGTRIEHGNLDTGRILGWMPDGRVLLLERDECGQFAGSTVVRERHARIMSSQAVYTGFPRWDCPAQRSTPEVRCR